MAGTPLKCFGDFDVRIEMNQNRWKKCILIESNQNKNQNASK
jgi:hypothetical protein